MNSSTGHRIMMTRSRRAQLLEDLSQETTSSSSITSMSTTSATTSALLNSSLTSPPPSSSSASTLTLNNGSTSSRKPPAMRCVCGKNSNITNITSNQLKQQQFDIIQCRKCNYGLHASCVGLTRPERLPTKDEQQAARLSLEIFVCNFCLKESGGRIGGVKLMTLDSSVTSSSSSSKRSGKNRNAATLSSSSSSIPTTSLSASSSSTNWKKTTQAQLNAAVEDVQLSPAEELAKIQQVHETPDRTILNQEPYRQMISNATEFLEKSGFTLITFPIAGHQNSSSSSKAQLNTSTTTTSTTTMNKISPALMMTPTQIEEQVMECSRSSIQDATFSEEYPLYCIRELQSRKHPYLQGAAAWCKKTQKIVAIVMSNGRDPYCDLKQTVVNLRQQISNGKVKLLSTPQEETKYTNKFLSSTLMNNGNVSSSSSPTTTRTTFTLNPTVSGSRIRQRTTEPSTSHPSSSSSTAAQQSSSSSSILSSNILSCVTTDPQTNSILFRKSAAKFAKDCLLFTDFDAVVHFTYIVTHEQYRGMKLAKTLMWIELARWALRGRKHACVNMALEKVYHYLPRNQKTKEDDEQQQLQQQFEATKKKFIIDNDDEESVAAVMMNGSPDGGVVVQVSNQNQNEQKINFTNTSSPRNSNSVVIMSHSRVMSNVDSGGTNHHNHRTGKKPSRAVTKKSNDIGMSTTALTTQKRKNNIVTRTTLNQKRNQENRTDDEEDEEEESFLECRVTEASRRLYSGLTFTEVFPRYTSEGNLRWTRKEENAGRMMLSIDFPAAMLAMNK